ncbi:lipase member H-like [Agrilus planipennis]|uniref:Lipase member H-like n=1 Tax=Agrilus planipennis TaxID=224129 RepID=A0A7F5R074_AGRPL|nr:lipase member H-like [Agrilus planipennis]
MFKSVTICSSVCLLLLLINASSGKYPTKNGPRNNLLLDFGKITIKNPMKNYDDPNTSPYGEYGIDWVYFPDGNGNIKIGFLRHPKYYNKNVASNSSTRTIFSKSPNTEEVVKFMFYNRKNNDKGGTTFLLSNMTEVLGEIDNSKPLKLITHGWLSNGHTKTCQLIKNSYLKKDDMNVIVMDWSEISDTVWYYKPLSKTKDVASYYSKIVEKIVANGMDPKHIHLIGHSLGAHVSGFAAVTLNRTTDIRIGRITV